MTILKTWLMVTTNILTLGRIVTPLFHIGQDFVGNDFGDEEDFEICDNGAHNAEDD